MERSSLVQGRRGVLALLLAACLLGSASAHTNGAGHRATAAVQAQLRASPTAPQAAANSTEAAADAKQRHAVVAAFRALAAVGEEQQQRGNEEEKSGGPVTMQVPEEELKEFVEQLSSRCKSQFSDILGGKSDLHTFGEGGARSKESCTEMKGSLCFMNAQVTQRQEVSGRKLKSVTEVSGKSCLPQDCMAENDLKVLAGFMKLKARDSMGGPHDLAIDIDLHVDCSANGGSSAGALSKVSERVPAEAKQPNENTIENSIFRPVPMHSAASARSALGAAVAMLGAAASAAAAA